MKHNAPRKKSKPIKRSKMGQGKRKPRSVRKYLRRLKSQKIKKKPIVPKNLAAKPARVIDYGNLRYARGVSPYHDCPYCENYRNNTLVFRMTNAGQRQIVICNLCSRKYLPK